MEKIIWSDHVRNEELLHRVKEERNIVHIINKGRQIGLVTCCVGTCFVKHAIGGKIEKDISDGKASKKT